MKLKAEAYQIRRRSQDGLGVGRPAPGKAPTQGWDWLGKCRTSLGLVNDTATGWLGGSNRGKYSAAWGRTLQQA